MDFPQLIAQASALVWGLPLIILLVGTGLYLTLRLRFIQIRGLPKSFRIITGKYARADDPGEVSHFRALSTALSGTVGTGNIVGVAAAILLGGPGAVFWMWVTAVVGMATKFTSCTLAVKFRRIDEHGETHGGPMHYIEQGLGPRFKWLAVLFAAFTAVASLGSGNMFQSRSMVAGVNGLIYGPDEPIVPLVRYSVGLLAAGMVAFVILGGIRRIARFTSRLVPFMCLLYLAGGLVILFKNADLIGPGLKLILDQAFRAPEAVSGGLLGGVIRHGVARGLFSNEAGVGSAAMAHSAARTDKPVHEGLIAMLGPMIDTLLICSVTALVIICTGTHEIVSAKGQLTGAAFERGLPGSGMLVLGGTVLFAFSTIIAWSYYGDRAADYLFGPRAVTPYRWLFVFFVFLGATQSFQTVINFCDTFNGLMAFANLVALLALAPVVARLLKETP